MGIISNRLAMTTAASVRTVNLTGNRSHERCQSIRANRSTFLPSSRTGLSASGLGLIFVLVSGYGSNRAAV